MRIPVSLVEKDYDDVFFLVDINYTYMQVVLPKVRWLKPFPYEINIDEASTTITPLLQEEIDKSATSFRNYEEAKSRITIDLKIASMVRKKNKIVKKLKEKFDKEEMKKKMKKMKRKNKSKPL